MSDISSLFTYILNEDTAGDYLVSPAVAYFCFDSVDFEFEKNDILSEDIYDDVKKEQKDLKKKRTSSVTGTVYKLTPEQKRCLKYLKKKYGNSLIKEIKQYRKNTLAPYQVAKSYMEKSKALYPKEVYGMTKEEYLKYKKSAENKIENMRSNKYSELTKDLMNINNKESRLNDMGGFLGNKNLSDTALNKVFKKYDFYSSKYSDDELRAFQRHINNVDKLKKEVLEKLASNSDVSQEDFDKIKKEIETVKSMKSDLSKKESDSEKNYSNIKALSKRVDSSNIPDAVKDELQDVLSGFEENGINVADKTFDQEYENFLTREKIRNDIKDGKDNKYVNDYQRALVDIKGDLSSRKEYTISKMAKERQSKTLNDMEKKIYELKPGMRPDTDRLSDYTLKIKEDDFFEPKFYQKSEKFKEAERQVDAEIKRFERGLESKMEPKDFQLLKKYRLISNLVTIKNAKLSDLFSAKKEEEKENQ